MSKKAPNHFPGEVLGRLTLVRQTSSVGDNSKWLCVCNCGWTGEKYVNRLRVQAAKGRSDVPRCKKGCASTMASRKANREMWKNRRMKKKYPQGFHPERRYFSIGNTTYHVSSWARFFGISRQRIYDLRLSGKFDDWLERNYGQDRLKEMGISFEVKQPDPNRKIPKYTLPPIRTV